VVNRKLLIIEDEDSILFAFHDYFTRLGYEVVCAPSRQQAEALIADSSYAAVVVDLRLGAGEEYQGLELARRVRERDPRTRVMIMTAYGTPQVEAEARRIGIDAFLHKPHPLGDVARLIAELTAAPGNSAAQHKEATP
jgi:DNA-binding response OmpR family regulator